MTRPKRTTQFVTCAALAVIVGGAVLAREQTLDSASLAALTAEVRLLRLSVERSAQAQAQIQAMAVYLSAQQSRLIQVSARADGLRKDVDGAIREVRHFADMVAETEMALTKPWPPQPPGTLPMRAKVEAQLAEARRDLARATTAEADLRNREAEATAAVQTELARWSEMIARLEQATRVPPPGEAR